MAEVVDSDEVQKIIDGIYKGLAERFNPATRQLITAGKTYLKALHGAVSASTAYVDALDRISRQAQQGAWGGCADISTALLQCVDVYKDIQAQQVTVLKAFYVDLLVPLENSLEKDIKIIQADHKKFIQDHKMLTDSHAKAAAAVKRDKKRSRSSKTGATLDKELKHLRALDEEKLKLNAFCEQSMKAALTAERRRYGFVLERQCSLSKHWQALFGKGTALLQHHLDHWFEIAKSREALPEHLETMALHRQRTPIEALYSSPFNDLDDPNSIAAQLRKSRSMDVSIMDLAEATNPNIAGNNNMVMGAGTINGQSTVIRSAKSDFNLSMLSSVDDEQRPMNGDETMNTSSFPDAGSTGSGGAGRRDLVRAIYSYLASGDHQLSFVEGDIVCLIGEKNKGWQFGENLRTGSTGWFPLAYTEQMVGLEDSGIPPQLKMVPAGQQQMQQYGNGNSNNNNGSQASTSTFGREQAKPRPVTMFGDTLIYRLPGKPKPSYPRFPMGCEGLPPPPPPPPPPGTMEGTPAKPQPDQHQVYSVSPLNTSNNSHNNSSSLSSPCNSSSSGNSSGSTGVINGGGTLHRQQQGPHGQQVYQQPGGPGFYGTAGKMHQGTVHHQANASLHSSNDSGFHNELHGAAGMGQQQQPARQQQAPPQPDADYSDDEPPRAKQEPQPAPAILPRNHAHDMSKNQVRLMVPTQEAIYEHEAPVMPSTMPRRRSMIPHPRSARAKSLKRSKSFFNRIAGKLRRDPRFTSADNLIEQGLWEHESIVPVDETYLRLSAVRLSDHEEEPITVKRKAELERSREMAVQSASTGSHTGSDSGHHTDGNEYQEHHQQLQQQQEDVNEAVARVANTPDSIAHSLSLESASDSELEGLKDDKHQHHQLVINDHAKSVDALNEESVLSSATAGVRRRSPRAQLYHSSRWVPQQPAQFYAPALMTRVRRHESMIANITSYDCPAGGRSIAKPLPVQPGALFAPVAASSPPPRSVKLTHAASFAARPMAPQPMFLKQRDVRAAQNHACQMSPHRSDFDIFEYGRYLERRLRCPEGSSQLDQQSTTTGHMCGPWYDLWGVDDSVRSGYQTQKSSKQMMI